MSFTEMMRSALRGILGNKLRSVLTLLGVMIGVGAVVLLLAVGNGSAQQVQGLIDQLGTNTLTVRPTGGGGGFGGAPGGGAVRFGAERAGGTASTRPITVAVSEELTQAELGHVSAIVPEVTTNQTVSSSSSSQSSISIIGTTPEYFDVTTAAVATGQSFTDADVTAASKVAVIGQTLASQLYPTGSALGQQLYIDGTSFTVVGILAQQSSTALNDPNSTVIAPITRIQRSYTGFGQVSSLTVAAIDSGSVAAAQAEITIMLNQLLRVSDTANEPFTITDQSSLLDTAAASAQSFTVLLGAVAAISLLVGGIGVTNVMLVTVTERTREIGIRKALGATRGAILGQFLAEAATLTLLGGALGVIAALIGAQYPINGTQPVVLDYSIPLALGVSVAIGMFFGVYPAAKAAAMRPIQALRAI